MYNVIILFGVSGCGKSLIGNQLSKDLQFEFIEGDDFHSNENIKKMKNNIPLNDDDREAWLDQINNKLNSIDKKFQNDSNQGYFEQEVSQIKTQKTV